MNTKINDDNNNFQAANNTITEEVYKDSVTNVLNIPAINTTCNSNIESGKAANPVEQQEIKSEPSPSPETVQQEEPETVQQVKVEFNKINTSSDKKEVIIEIENIKFTIIYNKKYKIKINEIEMLFPCNKPLTEIDSARDKKLVAFIGNILKIEKDIAFEIVNNFNREVALKYWVDVYSLQNNEDSEGKESYSDEEIIWYSADAVAEENNVICMAESRKLYSYVDGVYISKNVEIFLEKLLTDYADLTFGFKFLKKQKSDALDRIQSENPVSQTKFDKNKNIIVVKNGLLNIETGELREHTPDEIYTSKFNFNYDPNAQLSEVFKNYLNSVFEGVEYQIDIIQEFFGYCLCNHYKFAVFLLLLGEGGNGKGVLLNILKYFIGDQNASGLSLQDICSNDKFTLADLYQKKINVCGDISKAKIPNTDNLKKITGRDLIRAQFKYGQPFHFVNTAKIINACNEMPKITDETKGFFDRLIIIDFPNSFRNTENEDVNLEEKILTKESMSGILTWAIQGYQRLMKQGCFSHSKTLEEKMEQYTKKVDPLEFYIDNCITENQGGYVKTNDLYKDYVDFAKENDLKVFPEKTFKTKFLEACIDSGIVTRMGQKWIGNYTKRIRVFFDITSITLDDFDPQYVEQPTKKLKLSLN